MGRDGNADLACVVGSPAMIDGVFKASRRHPWETTGLVVLVALAAWLRLRELGLVEFKADESAGVELARRVLAGEFPTVGLRSSVGAYNPPLFVYLMAIPLAVRDDPLAGTAFVGVLAAVAVGLTFLVVRPRFGRLAALAAAGLFATAPWAVLYGRKIWAQDLLPVVTVTLLWSMFLVLERPRSRAVMLVPVFVCLAFQLNFSALALVVPAALLLLYRAREVHWWAFVGGLLLAVLLLAPWLGHELAHGFEDVSLLFSEGRGRGGSVVGAGSVEAIRDTFHVISAGGWSYVVGSSGPDFIREAGSAWTLGREAGTVAAALFVIGLVTSLVGVVRGAHLTRVYPFVELDIDKARRALLLAWIAGIWLSYATSATYRVLPHYMIVTYPVSFAVQGLGLSDLVSVVRGRFRFEAAVVGYGVLVAILAGYVAFTLSFHRFLEKEGGTSGDYGVVYRDTAALARFAKDRRLRVANDEAADFLVTRVLFAPLGTAPSLTVRDRLQDPSPIPCAIEIRRFGPLAV